jgi:hypothetical protein
MTNTFKTSALTVAPAGKAYSMMMCKLIEANSKALDAGGTQADALSEAIMLDVLASTVLVGWDAAEVGVPYSAKAARVLLQDRDLRRAVVSMADSD